MAAEMVDGVAGTARWRCQRSRSGKFHGQPGAVFASGPLFHPSALWRAPDWPIQELVAVPLAANHPGQTPTNLDRSCKRLGPQTTLAEKKRYEKGWTAATGYKEHAMATS